MKTILFFLLAALTVHAQSARYVTMTAQYNGFYMETKHLTVSTNELVTVLSVNNSNVRVTGVTSGGSTISFGNMFGLSGPAQTYTDLNDIAITSSSNVSVAATFLITSPTSGVVSNYVPANAIVIPESVTGPVSVTLESSTDLVNWTAANPGTYGPNIGTNRFFRVRAQVQ